MLYDRTMDEPIRLDELARRAGVASTTVRLYQNKGLLPGPRLVGRTGFYDDHHLARLRLIGTLQERGFSLASIAELLATRDRGGGLDALLGHEADLVDLLQEPHAVEMEAHELLERLPVAARSQPLMQRAGELGIVEVLPDGRLRVADPRFIDTGAALIALGVPADVVLDEWAALAAETDRIADRFIAVFEQHLLGSADDVAATLRRLRAIARDVVGAALDRSIVDRGRVRLERLGDERADSERARPATG